MVALRRKTDHTARPDCHRRSVSSTDQASRNDVGRGDPTGSRNIGMRQRERKTRNDGAAMTTSNSGPDATLLEDLQHASARARFLLEPLSEYQLNWKPEGEDARWSIGECV